LLFGFYNQFGGTLRADIDLATGAGKTVAAEAVREIPLYGSSTVMTKNYFNQFIQ
jgi:hypothetical protein